MSNDRNVSAQQQAAALPTISAAIKAAFASDSESISVPYNEQGAAFLRQFWEFKRNENHPDGPTGRKKMDTYPSGEIKDFRAGLRDRIGLPHLEYLKAMTREHCKDTGCNMQFTSRNYDVKTTPSAEWLAVFEQRPQPEQNMVHFKDGVRINRRIPNVKQLNKDQLRTMKNASLRQEEVIAVILYTGPMYMVYQSVLQQYERPVFENVNGNQRRSIFKTLKGDFGDTQNLYSTTLTVLVSAVQKLSTVTVFRPEHRVLYRGTGGEQGLPPHFFNPDERNCKGMTDWGFFSSTPVLDKAKMYSGVDKSMPCPIIFEIETDCVNIGASVGQFSQYPDEGEYMFQPCSFVEQCNTIRCQGGVLYIPVRIHTNKVQTLEDLEKTKMDLHISAFEFRIKELADRLERICVKADRANTLQRKEDEICDFVSSIIVKVNAVLEEHRKKSAEHFSDDSSYRHLVSESLQVVEMATSAAQLWTKNYSLTFDNIKAYDLLQAHRKLQWILKHIMWMASTGSQEKKDTAFELCLVRKLCPRLPNFKNSFTQRMQPPSACDETELERRYKEEYRSCCVESVDPDTRKVTGEKPLVALSADGGDVDDIALLVAAGADSFDESISTAAKYGHTRVVEVLEELRVNRSSASQPKFVVCCVTDRTPLENGPEKFGFGVSLSAGNKREKKKSFRTPAEFVCSEAFRNFEVRSTKNDVLSYFLPLWLSDKHWQMAKNEGPNGYPGFFQLCKTMWNAKESPFRSEKHEKDPAVIAARLLCRILSNMVADEISRGMDTEIGANEQLQRAASASDEPLSDACPSSCDNFGMMPSSLKGNTSDCFISGYFSILRLLKVLARENSAVEKYANAAWTDFVQKRESRCKCLSIGDLLVLLCITRDEINWDFAKEAFLDEFYLRLWKWFPSNLKKPEYEELIRTTDAKRRLQLTFEGSEVGRRLVCLGFKLTQLGKKPDLLGTVDGVAQDLTKLVDGTVPQNLLKHFRDIYSEVERVNNWFDFCTFLKAGGYDTLTEAHMDAIIVQSMKMYQDRRGGGSGHDGGGDVSGGGGDGGRGGRGNGGVGGVRGGGGGSGLGGGTVGRDAPCVQNNTMHQDRRVGGSGRGGGGDVSGGGGDGGRGGRGNGGVGGIRGGGGGSGRGGGTVGRDAPCVSCNQRGHKSMECPLVIGHVAGRGRR